MSSESDDWCGDGCGNSECTRDKGDGWGGLCHFCGGFYCSWHEDELTKLFLKHPHEREWNDTIFRCDECLHRINRGELVACKICHKVFDEDKDEMNPRGSAEDNAWYKCMTCADAFCTDCVGFLCWAYRCENESCPPTDCNCELVQCVLCRFREDGVLDVGILFNNGL